MNLSKIGAIARYFCATVSMACLAVLTLADVVGSGFEVGKFIAGTNTFEGFGAVETTLYVKRLLYIAFFSLLICVVPERRYFGLVVPTSSRATRQWFGVLLVAFAIMLLTGIAGSLMREAAGASAEIGSSWSGQPLNHLLLRSLHAGVSEEIVSLAIPFGGVLFWMSIRRGLARNLYSQIENPLVWPRAGVIAGAVLVGVLILSRVSLHLYQGPEQIPLTFLWTTTNAVLMIRYRTVLPLIAAHVLYDFFIAGGLISMEETLFCILAGATLISGLLLLNATRDRTPKSKNAAITT